jgi:hypothetical protein
MESWESERDGTSGAGEETSERGEWRFARESAKRRSRKEEQ